MPAPPNYALIENHMVIDQPAFRAPRHNLTLETAQESADLLSLDDLSREWDLHSLIEALPTDELNTVMPILRRQAAREMVGGDL